jgi:hypothetical protein
VSSQIRDEESDEIWRNVFKDGSSDVNLGEDGAVKTISNRLLKVHSFRRKSHQTRQITSAVVSLRLCIPKTCTSPEIHTFRCQKKKKFVKILHGSVRSFALFREGFLRYFTAKYKLK